MSETASLVADLEKAREAFQRMTGPKQIQTAHYVACSRSPSSLASLVALREALPPPFRDFKDFEGSRLWRLKDAYAVFDRAILSARERSAPHAG